MITQMTAPALDITENGSATELRVSGRLVTEFLHLVEKPFAKARVAQAAAVLDLSQLEALDTAGACMITSLQRRLEASGVKTSLTGARADWMQLIETVAQATAKEPAGPAPEHDFLAWVRGLGARVVSGLRDVESFLSFMGLVIARLMRTLMRPRRLRVAALFTQMQETGFNAIPIVVLMGFLIGIVLAYQGAAQLRQFGAEVFVVDLIAVSVLRELGIMLTAIIVAGRSGSAYAAAIGSMKVNEEVDAMRTLGLDPIEVLVLPRVIAMIIMLPLLGLLCNVTALIGGGLMSWVELGVSPDMFVTRFYENTDVWHLIVGMVKAPIFGFVIALIACWQGFQVAASADSVGQRTRASVVQAIFMVIMIDAVFSVFFVEVGV